MIALYVVVSAIILDWIVGEPKRYHPLVLFGSIAQRSEQISDKPLFENISPFMRGLICWILLVAPPTLASWFLIAWMPLIWQVVTECLILYFAIGWKSMQQHAMAVYRQLQSGDIEQARHAVRKIVSRETDNLDQRDIAKGAIEAVLENGSDCVLSPIFWYMLLGAPGALMFRLVNTLDAMWGYKTGRYLYFGRTAAKIDDFLNWIPARLTAIGYAISGQLSGSISCMKNQKAESEGPNAGIVMAAGGGALGIRLGGPVVYHGKLDQRPILGQGREVETEDIVRSIWLVWRTIGIWMLVIVIVALSLS